MIMMVFKTIRKPETKTPMAMESKTAKILTWTETEFQMIKILTLMVTVYLMIRTPMTIMMVSKTLRIPIRQTQMTPQWIMITTASTMLKTMMMMVTVLTTSKNCKTEIQTLTSMIMTMITL